MSATTETKSINELRADYRRMRDAGRFIFGRKWDAAVLGLLESRGGNPTDATPEQWVDAAESVEIQCERCKGTGVYRWGAFDLIKKTSAHSGPCYQCCGRGTQDMDDMFRNRAHVHYLIAHAV